MKDKGKEMQVPETHVVLQSSAVHCMILFTPGITNDIIDSIVSMLIGISLLYYCYFFTFVLFHSIEFPKLTDQHILNAFIDSGVSNNHVHHLGILLGLSEDAMHTIEDSNHGGPAMFALNTVNAWLKKDPLTIGDNIQGTFVELENKLRQVHLNCVIGKLRQKETPSM